MPDLAALAMPPEPAFPLYALAAGRWWPQLDCGALYPPPTTPPSGTRPSLGEFDMPRGHRVGVDPAPGPLAAFIGERGEVSEDWYPTYLALIEDLAVRVDIDGSSIGAEARFAPSYRLDDHDDNRTARKWASTRYLTGRAKLAAQGILPWAAYHQTGKLPDGWRNDARFLGAAERWAYEGSAPRPWAQYRGLPWAQYVDLPPDW